MANLMQKNWYWLTLLALPFLFAFRRRNDWDYIVTPQKIRNDAAGDGSWGVDRDNGKRKHNGIDFLVRNGQYVHTPIPGKVVRYANPYPEDGRWGGLLIQGSGEYAAYQVKIFYIQPIAKPGQTLGMGSVVGRAQSISIKYGSNMLDHVHVEVYRDGQLINPATVLSISS